MTHKNTYEVVPGEGVEPVRLGMSRERARESMDLPRRELVDQADRHTPLCDVYLGGGYQIYYDMDDRVEEIRLTYQCPLRVEYRGLRIFEADPDEVIRAIEQVAKADPGVPMPGAVYCFPALEMHLWRPVAPRPASSGSSARKPRFSLIGIGSAGYLTEGRFWSGRKACEPPEPPSETVPEDVRKARLLAVLSRLADEDRAVFVFSEEEPLEAACFTGNTCLYLAAEYDNEDGAHDLALDPPDAIRVGLPGVELLWLRGEPGWDVLLTWLLTAVRDDTLYSRLQEAAIEALFASLERAGGGSPGV